MIVLRKLKSSLGSLLVGQPLLGQVDGVNKTFTTPHNFNPERICVFYNGQELVSPFDFEIVGTNVIEFIYVAPEDRDVINATYELA